MIHIPNSSNNVSINNNIFWHTETLGQMILLQSGTQDSITISNNLAVEDDVAGAIPFAVYGVHGLAVEHNTIVNDQGYPGTFLGPPCTDEPNCYANSQNMVADYNISVAGQPDFGSWSCASSCVVGRNVSGDSSADSLRGSSGTSSTGRRIGPLRPGPGPERAIRATAGPLLPARRASVPGGLSGHDRSLDRTLHYSRWLSRQSREQA